MVAESYYEEEEEERLRLEKEKEELEALRRRMTNMLKVSYVPARKRPQNETKGALCPHPVAVHWLMNDADGATSRSNSSSSVPASRAFLLCCRVQSAERTSTRSRLRKGQRL